MQSKLNKIWEKILASVLVVALTAGNLMLIGSNLISYAGENLEAQDEKIEHTNVEFGAYFESEGKKVHSLVSDAVSKEKLYMHLNVKEAGYLKSGKIEIVGANYKIAGEVDSSEIIGYKGENFFNLKQIGYGTEAVLEVPIKLEVGENFNVTNIQKDSNVVLTGIYVTTKGEEIEINKSVTLNLGWREENAVSVKSRVETYKTYAREEGSGIIIQEKIEVEREKGVLPVSKTNIKIDAIKYAGTLPTSVIVTSTKTEMTNGKTYEDVELDYNYSKETGKVEITTINEALDGGVYSKQGGKDEYTVTYEYGQEAYEAKLSEIEVATKVNVVVENYTAVAEEKEAVAGNQKSLILTDEFGSLVNSKITIKEEINKAKMYANYNSNRREYETAYTVKELVSVVKPSLIDEIIIESKPGAFIDKDENEYSTRIETVDYTYHKSTKIAESSFKELLGEEGILVVENVAGEEIGRIDNTTKSKDGIYEIIYEDVEQIKIITSKPITEGSLILEHEKAIKADLGYSKVEVLGFAKLCEKVNIGTNEEIREVIGEQELQEAENNMKVETNKESINKKEENIEIKVELGNNNSNSILYSNPNIRITLPKFVENVEIVNTNLLFESELTLGNTQIVGSENGEKVVEVKLNGTQTKFSSMENGATLVLGAAITSKQEAGEGIITAEVEGNTAKTSITSYLKAEEIYEQVILGEGASEQTGEETDDEEAQEESRINLYISSSLVKAEEENIVTYIIYLSDVTNYEESENVAIENIVVKDFLPSGVTFEKASMEKYNIETEQYEEVENAVEYDVKNRVATWNVGSMSGEPQIMLKIKVKIDTLSQGIYEKEISNSVIASYDGMANITSNIAKITVAKAYINIIKTTENIGNTNKEGDIVKFALTGKNIGGLVARDFKATMTLPEELEPISMRYGIDENITDMSQGENNIELWKVDLEPGATYLFEVEAKIKELPNDYTEQYKEITVNATMNNEEISWVIKIENSNYNSGNPSDPSNPNTPNNPDGPQNPDTPNNPDGPQNPDTPNNPGEIKKYTISGTAWLDENKNGVKEEGEQLLEQIKVKLLKENTSIKETLTDKKGKYTFEQVEVGEYQIAFEYDANLYGVTEYRKTGNLEVNSNAIKSTEGEAVTDIVKVANMDVQHMNIGLTKIPTFDMSLSKVVSRVIVQNSQGTKEYTYGNDYAKLDINGKYLNGTVVLVEYKITIKNEGELAGKVKKIVDYVPKDMTFSTEINSTWIQDSDGNLYNSELKDLDIEPGETKEITVVLKKKMTEENTGIINNTAEIVEVENSENIKDKDSTPNNKVQGEDDMSSANVLIGVKTGAEVMYITLGIVILIVLAVGIYLINKEVLRK